VACDEQMQRSASARRARLSLTGIRQDDVHDAITCSEGTSKSHGTSLSIKWRTKQRAAAAEHAPDSLMSIAVFSACVSHQKRILTHGANSLNSSTQAPPPTAHPLPSGHPYAHVKNQRLRSTRREGRTRTRQQRRTVAVAGKGDGERVISTRCVSA
jgi:hypothetical protein